MKEYNELERDLDLRVELLKEIASLSDDEAALILDLLKTLRI